ncbi:MAG TPA: DUF4010 domain-containing protein [Candidatus Polarisedimenticolaceae bacterium]|nr:DUF4010 domain-containing protein [Candidatus Polarisedimenticolaceae bacterium]
MFAIARPFLLALAIGLMIGIERERAQRDNPTHHPLGSRTFTLIALLGAVAAHLASQTLAAVLALFVLVMIVAGYFKLKIGAEGEGVGATTEVAAMVTFILGYLARLEPELSIMLGVLTLVVLAIKPRLHEFARAGLTQQEVSAALTFLVIAFVVFPLLPDRYVDPWGLINPARLWLIFLLIAGISFGGYAAVRVLGAGRGLAVAGLSAGLVSSTTATVVLAQKSRDNPALTGPAATGIVLANMGSAVAQLVIVAVIYPEMEPAVAPLVIAPVVLGALATAGALWVMRAQDAGEPALLLENPLSLRRSAKLAAVLAVVLVITSAASRFLGTAGVLTTALLAGTTNHHAVTLAVTNLVAAGDLGTHTALLAITCGFVANMLVKLVLAGWVGGRRLLLAVAPPLVGMMAAAVVAYLLSPAG